MVGVLRGVVVTDAVAGEAAEAVAVVHLLAAYVLLVPLEGDAYSGTGDRSGNDCARFCLS